MKIFICNLSVHILNIGESDWTALFLWKSLMTKRYKSTYIKTKVKIQTVINLHLNVSLDICHMVLDVIKDIKYISFNTINENKLTT